MASPSIDQMELREKTPKAMQWNESAYAYIEALEAENLELHKKVELLESQVRPSATKGEFR